MIEIRKEFQNKYALYKLTTTTGELWHVGILPFRELMATVDAPIVPDGLILYMTIIQIDVDRLKLAQIGKNMVDALKRYDLSERIVTLFKTWTTGAGKMQSRAVRCIDTGELFPSIKGAAKSHDLSYNALFKHLNGEKSYNSVKGRRYEYAD